MRDAWSLFWAGFPRPGKGDWARFSRMTYVGKPAGHQRVPPADLATKVS